MPHRQFDPEAQVLSEPVATRLLERASQLDAARVGSTAVSDLRAAATAAGISRSAFDAALEKARAELSRLQSSGSAACTLPPAPAKTP